MSSVNTELLRRFETQQINPGEFGHRQHLEVAYAMLHTYDFMQTCTMYSTGINTFAIDAGVPEKFNMTVTLAFLSLLAERIHASTQDNFDDFLADNQDLMSKDFLNKWYTTEQLESEFARQNFLLPKITSSEAD